MGRVPIIVYQFGRLLYSLPPDLPANSNGLPLRPLAEIVSPVERKNMLNREVFLEGLFIKTTKGGLPDWAILPSL